VAVGKQISPYLELCCLRTSANVSYANAASDVAMLTGIRVSGKTQQRLVQGYDFPLPSAVSPIQGACTEHVPQVLAHRAAYLNGLISQ
jgi:hypothetical protein